MAPLDAPCVLRCYRGQVERRDAYDVACDLIVALRKHHCAIALYVHADNSVEFVRVPAEASPLALVDRDPVALVGVYAWGAMVADVRDDILAMPRGEPI